MGTWMAANTEEDSGTFKMCFAVTFVLGTLELTGSWNVCGVCSFCYQAVTRFDVSPFSTFVVLMNLGPFESVYNGVSDPCT